MSEAVASPPVAAAEEPGLRRSIGPLGTSKVSDSFGERWTD